MQDSNRHLLPAWASTLLVVLVAAGTVALIRNLVAQNQILREALNISQSPRGVSPGLEVGDALPSVNLRSLTGEVTPLNALLEGGSVIAFFTTTFVEAMLTFAAILTQPLDGEAR